MNLTGNVRRVYQDYETGKFHVDIVFNEGVPVANELIDFLNNNTVVQADVKKESKKRSLDSNAYAWVLMSKIAEKQGISKDEVYEQMLQDYPRFYEDEQGCIAITVKKDVDMSKVGGHWFRYKESKDGNFVSYLMIKGSSEYDTKEMSHFIDMIVYEAKEHGIETMTPNQIAEMNARWGTE